MDKPKVILFYELCRLCLENPGVEDMFTKENLVQDIYLCTGVKVTSQDNLPCKICTECLEVVVKAKQLRVLATANETHLKSLFNKDDIFIIHENEISHNENRPMSRKSSTDSDKTVKLVIVENDVEDNISPNKIQPTCQPNNDDIKKISVRKDLFDSAGAAVTSSTADVTSTESKSTKKSTSDRHTDYECEICQKKFSSWKKMYFHNKTHNKHIRCPIDLCGKKFATKGDLEKHIRTHTGERPFRCDVCHKSFAQRGTLKAHSITVHADLMIKEEPTT